MFLARRKRGEQHVASVVVVWTAELSFPVSFEVFGGRAYRGREAPEDMLLSCCCSNSGILHEDYLNRFWYFEEKSVIKKRRSRNRREIIYMLDGRSTAHVTP